MTHHSGHEDKSLAARVRTASGLSVAKCYQCGKCSAGCPMVEEMGTKTHELLRLVQLDRKEVLHDESLWLCLTCETCTARCPNEVDPARIIDALREMALQETRPPRRINAFHKAFLKQIRSHGRVFEFGLVKGFKLRGGPLFADLLAAPGMLFKGKLPLVPKKIKGRKDVRRIFDACAAESEGGTE